MKKYLTFLLLFILLIVSKSNAQYNSGIITYEKDYYKSFYELNKTLRKNDPERFNEYNRIWENSKAIAKNLQFTLLFNGLESIFKAKDIVSNDIAPFEIEFALGIYGASVFYKNSLKNTYYRKTDAYGETFIIEMPDVKWKLINASKIINGYECYKAVTQTVTLGRKGEIKKDVVAWYSPAIPVSFGPIGFGGLPGLIIRLIYDNEVYTVEKIDLNPSKPVKITKPSKGIKVSKIEFEKIGLNKVKDFRKMVK